MSVVISLRNRIPNLIFLIWLLAVPGGAGVTEKEIASLSLDNQTRIGIHVYYFPHAHTVHLRLDDYNRSDDKRWQEIDLVPEQWEKFKSALLQAGESSGGQQIATLVDFDQGRGSWLKVAADPKAGGARLTLARPDSYTRGQGDEAGQVVIGLTAESVKELATHFSAADQALKDGPPMVAPAGSVWKLQEVKVLRGFGEEGPDPIKIVQADAKGGKAVVGGATLSWSFDQDISTLKGDQKVKAVMLNQGPGQPGDLVPAISLHLVGERQTSPLSMGGEESPFDTPAPEPFYGYQHYPKDPNPAVQHFWRRSSQSKRVYPGKDPAYNDTMDGGKGVMMLRVNPSGASHAMFFFSLSSSQPRGSSSVCYLFVRE